MTTAKASLLRQYLYFCTSKASKLSTAASEGEERILERPKRVYVEVVGRLV
jgi:hypothetical protein